MNKAQMQYSENELKLFQHFGFEDVAPHVYPPVLYPMMAAKAFIIRDETLYAESLRRCILHLEAGKYRMTPEFEALIQLEEINHI